MISEKKILTFTRIERAETGKGYKVIAPIGEMTLYLDIDLIEGDISSEVKRIMANLGIIYFKRGKDAVMKILQGLNKMEV